MFTRLIIQDVFAEARVSKGVVPSPLVSRNVFVGTNDCLFLGDASKVGDFRSLLPCTYTPRQESGHLIPLLPAPLFYFLHVYILLETVLMPIVAAIFVSLPSLSVVSAENGYSHHHHHHRLPHHTLFFPCQAAESRST